MSEKLSLFGLINSLSYDKVNHIELNPDNLKAYNAWMTNVAFSLHADSIFYANEMNRLPHLSAQLQHDFYFHGLPKRKRFSKWPKKMEVSDEVEFVAEFYDLNNERAREIVDVLKATNQQNMLDKITKIVKSKKDD